MTRRRGTFFTTTRLPLHLVSPAIYFGDLVCMRFSKLELKPDDISSLVFIFFFSKKRKSSSSDFTIRTRQYNDRNILPRAARGTIFFPLQFFSKTFGKIKGEEGQFYWGINLRGLWKKKGVGQNLWMNIDEIKLNYADPKFPYSSPLSKIFHPAPASGRKLGMGGGWKIGRRLFYRLCDQL